MKRPKQTTGNRVVPERERARVARKASYLGSPEHKTLRWWGGLPQGRRPRPKKQLTTPCPLLTETDRERATEWVRKAIRRGDCEFVEGDGDFPKRIWHRDENGQLWRGLLVNRTTGEYKGWPETDEGF